MAEALNDAYWTAFIRILSKFCDTKYLSFARRPVDLSSLALKIS